MRNALAAGQHRIGELLGLEVRVAADVLEPLHRVLRRALDLQHLHGARILVDRQHPVQSIGSLLAEAARELDRVLEGELRARADRVVRGVRGVAHQHHRHLPAVDRDPVHPVPADDARELDPDRGAAQVRRVGEQPVAVELGGEQPLAEGDPLVLGHPIDAGPLPHVLGRLDDERRRAVVVLVDVRLEPAEFGLLEGEGERAEPPGRAEPDETAAARVDVRAEDALVARADGAVDAVAGDHEVRAVLRRHRLVVGDIGLEYELDAELLAARLQDVEQPLAADPAEAVAAGRDPVPLEEHIDVVPVVERLQNRARRRLVGVDEVAEGLVREHDAPAERVVGPVALENDDFVRRILLLHQDAEVEAGRPAADAHDLHPSPPSPPDRRATARRSPPAPPEVPAGATSRPRSPAAPPSGHLFDI